KRRLQTRATVEARLTVYTNSGASLIPVTNSTVLRALAGITAAPIFAGQPIDNKLLALSGELSRDEFLAAKDPLQPQARARRTTYASSYPFPTPVINFAWQCGLLGITAPPVLAGSPIENEMHLRAVLEREYREIYVENLGWDVT
ncbi:hypothetical protein GN958_ATG03873, partial [Phytophthora infestans]